MRGVEFTTRNVASRQRYIAYKEGGRGEGETGSGERLEEGEGGANTNTSDDTTARRPLESPTLRPHRPKSTLIIITQQFSKIVKMATVASKTIMSSGRMGLLSNIAPSTRYVSQRKYAIRPAEIPTAK